MHRRVKSILLSLFAGLILACPISAGQRSPDGIWSEVAPAGSDLHQGARLQWSPEAMPRHYRTVRFNRVEWESFSTTVPLEGLESAPSERPAPAIISLPLPDGRFAEFEIFESSVMAPGLASRYESIRTFVGRGVQDHSSTLRAGHGPNGFHAQIMGPGGVVYIDAIDSAGTHVSYYRADIAPTSIASCLADAPFADATAHGPRDRSGKFLRTYRLALACTGEYAQYHGGSVEDVLAAMTTTLNRVNGIFEVELGIRLELIERNDELVFLDSVTDPYTNASATVMLFENQTMLDGMIGDFNYDVGHVLATSPQSDAALGAVCVPGRKAQGVSGDSSPINDLFDVDVVAHTFGHQFGATHTSNGIEGECYEERSAQTAYEPGSGSTIMALPGRCNSDNLQSRSDPYFHAASFDQIFLFAKNEATCAVLTETGNRGPTADAGNDYVVPAGTPFVLSGTATDPDFDALTYTWEEIDRGPQAQLDAPDDGRIPLFRSLEPSSSSARTFPNWTDLRFNVNNSAEKLPVLSRTMKFRFMARDGRTDSGGVHFDDMQLFVDAGSGPFRVLSPNGGEHTDDSISVEWDPAGTNQPPVNTGFVDIFLSIDDGDTFDFMLADKTPNDGSHVVTLPGVDFSTARVLVRAVNNVFFDLSDAPFTIGEGTLVGSPRVFTSLDAPKPTTENGLTTSVITIPEQFFIFDVDVTLNVSHTWVGDLKFELRSPDGTIVALADSLGVDGDNYTNTTFDDEASLSIVTASPPFTGVFRPVEALAGFNDRTAQGTWTLRIFDNKPADVGTLHGWSLRIVPRLLSQLDEVWVDHTYSGQELGTPSKPFNTLAEAGEVVRPGGLIRIIPGASHEVGVFAPRATVITNGPGPAVLGAAASPPE